MSGSDTLINVVKMFLDDSEQSKERAKNFDMSKYFEQNHITIVQNVSYSFVLSDLESANCGELYDDRVDAPQKLLFVHPSREKVDRCIKR